MSTTPLQTDAIANRGGDWRNLANGIRIASAEFFDQPYIVQVHDRAWLCVLAPVLDIQA